MSYVFHRSSAAIMHDSGGAKVVELGILMTSAVAMFFSCSGATDLSDLWVQYLCFGSDFRDLFRLSFGRAIPVKVMRTPLLSSAPCYRPSRRSPDAVYAKPCSFP